MSLTIRLATDDDVSNLRAWNAAMAWETEHRRLDEAVLERGVRGVLAQPRRGFYLVAEREGVAVGGLLVTYEWSGETERRGSLDVATKRLTSQLTTVFLGCCEYSV